MKTDVILVEKGKGIEGYLLLQSKGFKTFGSQRLRYGCFVTVYFYTLSYGKRD
jgi:hypothetical protein